MWATVQQRSVKIIQRTNKNDGQDTLNYYCLFGHLKEAGANGPLFLLERGEAGIGRATARRRLGGRVARRGQHDGDRGRCPPFPLLLAELALDSPGRVREDVVEELFDAGAAGQFGSRKAPFGPRGGGGGEGGSHRAVDGVLSAFFFLFGFC